VGNDTTYFTGFAFILHDKATTVAPIPQDGETPADRLDVQVVNGAIRVR
jgi:hypothetical protein